VTYIGKYACISPLCSSTATCLMSSVMSSWPQASTLVNNRVLKPSSALARSCVTLCQLDPCYNRASPLPLRYNSPARFSRASFAHGPIGHFVDAVFAFTNPRFSRKSGTLKDRIRLRPSLLRCAEYLPISSLEFRAPRNAPIAARPRQVILLEYNPSAWLQVAPDLVH
jgi:hypothetical protein